MALKDLLVAYDGSRCSDAALRHALKMAKKYDAHVTAALALGSPADIPWMAREGGFEEAMIKVARERAVKIEARFREQAGEGDRMHWLLLDGRPDSAIIEQSRYFDTVLVGYGGKSAPNLAMHPDIIALQSGRPVIMVPESYDQPLGTEAVVAWDGQRAAARALSDAMQILETKEHVRILTVGTERGTKTIATQLGTHLERHGIASEWVLLPPARHSVSAAIVTWCAENEPSLLVMGAYEHSKFREDLLGGATNSILNQAKFPVMLCH